MTGFTGFLVKRILQAVVVLFLVSIIVFVLLHLLPGGPARAILGPKGTPQQIEHFNHQQGYDRSLPTQYLMYLKRLLTGDLGESFKLNSPVLDLLRQRLPKTLLLTVLSTVLAVVIAVPLGLLQAVRRGKASDYALTGLTFLLYATPVFFLGLIMIILFAQVMPILPAEAPQGETIADLLGDVTGLILPVVTMAFGIIAMFSRYMRSAVLDNLTEEYVRTAMAKGQSSRRIMGRHVLRNALIPLATLLGLYLPTLFSGALVVESMFNYPGMGLLFWNAAQGSDFPVLLGVTLVVGVATVVGSLLTDILYAVLDPRIRSVA
ncbi:ABC transporter permease [Streptomyces alfalfae]|uniref:Diguanylate cyclase n=1 Tax=Streptomyces alfalfae TaxID=1642299 RepID=A0ABN4VR31_9ACTN|nr:ABC transporter permease [Streptomyces alfalfae]AYA19895.1 ABC transporter permease [Streptomyces fradiae]APY89462.1 diguanylate cyclase [Streptomyces alfalfae]QUI30508.1 ABC transporter permease [Streptomyces alfalfae]RXX44248.1 ABC transporter permease [Streptomyces alfalfae]RZM99022.1 ABC transporter permease [Streptomyces alfalfae]